MDDLALQVEGARQHILATIRRLAKQVKDGFDQLQIPLPQKTAVVASDQELEGQVAEVFGSVGTEVRAPGVVGDLGVDAGPGHGDQRPTRDRRVG